VGVFLDFGIQHAMGMRSIVVSSVACLVLLYFCTWEPSCSVRTDGRTGVMKLIVTFGNLAKAPEKSKVALSIRQ
jgi:hypothetical protein